MLYALIFVYIAFAVSFFHWATWGTDISAHRPARWKDIGINAVWAVFWFPLGLAWLCMALWVVWTFQRSLAE